MRKIIFFFIPCIFTFSGFANIQQHVYQKAGNIYLRSGSNSAPLQLTHLSQDSKPVLSPDSHWVAFLRKARFKIQKKCTSYYDPNNRVGFEIWIYNLSSKKEKLLVANNFACDDPIKVIIDPSDLQFSPDSKTLYFETSDLIINQHRYHDGGRSYNWDWLFTPNGKQIKLYRKWD